MALNAKKPVIEEAVSPHLRVDLASFIPGAVGKLEDPQLDLPRIARDAKLTQQIEWAIQRIPTHHTLFQHDARSIGFLQPESVHLILTSPPYWTLKEYRPSDGQMGHI